MSSNKQNPMIVTYAVTLVAIILWGFSFVWTNQIINENVPIFTFLFVRLTIAGLLLLLYSKAAGKLQKVTAKDFAYMFLMAFFEPFIYFIGESYGMQETGSAVIAAVIIATIPITCLIAENVIYKVPYTFNKIVGAALTIPGIAMVVLNGSDNSVNHYYGIALLFVAVAGATGYASVVRKLSGKYNSTTIATYQFLIGALLFFPFFLIFGLDGINTTFFSAKVLLPLISLAVLCSCVAFICWITAIKNLGMTKANIFSALIPAVSAIGAAMAGQEKITVITVIGIIVVIWGVILAQRK